WDEVDVPLTQESDLDYAKTVLLGVADRVAGPDMMEPIRRYRGLLERASLDFDIPEKPQVFFSQGESWTNATVRYLVDARRRRSRASELRVARSRDLAREERRSPVAVPYPTTRLGLPERAERDGE